MCLSSLENSHLYTLLELEAIINDPIPQDSNLG